MAVCPVDCFYRTDDGVVLHDKDVCIGCGYCSYACPFGAPQFPSNGTFGLRGKMDKCTFCAGGPEANGSEAEFEKYGRNRLAEGKLPACAEMCSTKALLGGDGDVVADIFRNRVLKRGKGSEVWGWGTAYGKPAAGAPQRPSRRARSHEASPLALVAAAALALAACGEKPQTGAARARSDAPGLAGRPGTAFIGRAGSRATRPAGSSRLRNRAQGQNEYSRAAAQPERPRAKELAMQGPMRRLLLAPAFALGRCRRAGRSARRRPTHPAGRPRRRPARRRLRGAGRAEAGREQRAARQDASPATTRRSGAACASRASSRATPACRAPRRAC